MSAEKPDTANVYTTDEKQLAPDVSTPHSETETMDENQAGDTALANAPWQYKLIALVTALCFPSKKKKRN